MFSVKASTPEEMRQQVVKWLEHQALVSKASKVIANGKREEATLDRISGHYAEAAKFWREVSIAPAEGG